MAQLSGDGCFVEIPRVLRITSTGVLFEPTRLLFRLTSSTTQPRHFTTHIKISVH